MGRWTQYDEDEYRLPEGMQRTGYDADTGKYYFRDRDGSVYTSTTEYGPMTKESDGALSQGVYVQDEDDTEATATTVRPDGYQSVPSNMGNSSANGNKEAYRTLLPFFLIIGVVLLAVWRYIIYPSVSSSPETQCASDQTLVIVQPGDSCWEISTVHHLSLDEMKRLNPDLNCDPLLPGSSICIPSSSSTS